MNTRKLKQHKTDQHGLQCRRNTKNIILKLLIIII